MTRGKKQKQKDDDATSVNSMTTEGKKSILTSPELKETNLMV